LSGRGDWLDTIIINVAVIVKLVGRGSSAYRHTTAAAVVVVVIAAAAPVQPQRRRRRSG